MSVIIHYLCKSCGHKWKIQQREDDPTDDPYPCPECGGIPEEYTP